MDTSSFDLLPISRKEKFLLHVKIEVWIAAKNEFMTVMS